MQINPLVIRALMHLRNVGERELSNLVHVRHVDLRAWLYEEGEDSESRVAFETQLEVLSLLGVRGDHPRADVVHYWRVHEPLLARRARSYWALDIVLDAFGPAQVAYLAREADPMLAFEAKAYFGLKFGQFAALLEVGAHPLRNISLDPAVMPGLTWVQDAQGVLLGQREYDMLEPGALRVRNMQQYLTYTTEMAQWEKLRDAALEHGLRAQQIAAMLTEAALLSYSPSAPPPAAPVAGKPEAPSADKPGSADDDLRLFSQPLAGVRPTRPTSAQSS
jgi:hypothetical protein